MSESELTLRDCIFRDGGYYTNWEFAPQLVDAYFSALARSQALDVVELGYVRFHDGGYGGYGEFGRVPAGLRPEHAAELATGSRPRFAAMLDADSPKPSTSYRTTRSPQDEKGSL